MLNWIGLLLAGRSQSSGRLDTVVIVTSTGKAFSLKAGEPFHNKALDLAAFRIDPSGFPDANLYCSPEDVWPVMEPKEKLMVVGQPHSDLVRSPVQR
ncbi:MAG: hypothetical protein KIS92_20090, partial [Planctomycetota bacterium]|nr:hypothetical protein [Planctomycetota bacterium]